MEGEMHESVDSAAWKYLGIKWTKPVGQRGYVSFKWPSLIGWTAGWFVLGALIF
jgi:hypothetical protein